MKLTHRICFRDYAQNTVLAVVDRLCKEQNIKSVPENQRIPIQHSFEGIVLNK